MIMLFPKGILCLCSRAAIKALYQWRGIELIVILVKARQVNRGFRLEVPEVRGQKLEGFVFIFSFLNTMVGNKNQ